MSLLRIVYVLSIVAIVVLLLVGGVAAVLFNVSVVNYEEGDLSAGEELFKYNTDPLSVDTDGDGLSDYQEVKVYESDPLVKDSDDDGLGDGQEIEIGSSPVKIDTDGDNLSDVREQEIGTNPAEKDTDGDGLSDYREYNELETSPTTANSDDDYLNDYEEVNEYDTNPVEADTSGDGFKDGILQEASEEHPSLYTGDLSPSERHIFVYITVSNGSTIPKDEVEHIKSEFEDRGYVFHAVYSEEPISNDNSIGVRRAETLYEQSKMNQMGFHYVIMVDKITGQSERTIGITRKNSYYMLVENQRTTAQTGQTIMHELGHTLGIYNSTFSGVDSQQYTSQEYPSVMNTNYEEAIRNYSYSSNNLFNGWKYINENMHTPPTTKLEEQIDNTN